MRLNHERAQFVFVWLGPAAEDSDDAMDLLERLAHASRRFSKRGVDSGNCDLWEERRQRYLGIVTPNKGHKRFHALVKLFNRRWWMQAWVLQEIAVATRA